jgi:hypothetical protein
MPVYKIGDLVKPRLSEYEDGPDAIGLIVEMRDMMHMKPEAKIIWSDLPGHAPRWMWLTDVVSLEVD